MADFSKYANKDLTKPRDKAWENWAKFDKKGDKVTGIIRDVFYRPAQDQFREQRGFTLEQESGELINIGLKRDPYFAIRATDEARLGDLLTIELGELRPSKTKGYSPTKIYSFSSGTLPENEANPTVRELEELDMKAQGVKPTTPTTPEEKVDDVPFE
jgi:hypothetical protein